MTPHGMSCSVAGRLARGWLEMGSGIPGLALSTEPVRGSIVHV